VGLTGMQHADGEIHAARAAEKFGIPFTLSTMSICSIEDIAEHTKSPFWFQLYMMRDRDAMAKMIDRCKSARCSALVLTLDLQVIGQRHKDLKNGLTAPPRPTLRNIVNLMTKPRWCLGMAGTRRHTFRNLVGHVKGVSDMSSLAAWTNEQFDPRLSWPDVAWVKKQWGGKLILKGIMDVEDARPSRPRSARHRGRRRRADRGLDGRRHPQRTGRAEGLGAGRTGHDDRPRHGLRPGRDGRSRRDESAADHPQGTRRHDGVLRAHPHR
jgi:L-lactate dehydrogenase (cytochrome)